MLVVWLLVVVSSVSSLAQIAENESCNTWYYVPANQSKCVCRHPLSEGLVCSEVDKRVYLHIEYCMSQTESGQLLVGLCRYGYQQNSSLVVNRNYNLQPENPEDLNRVQCGQYNRRGLLCRECMDGFGPPVYSIKSSMFCSNCSDVSTFGAVVAYLTLELVPVTLLFFLIMLFRINIMTGPLLGYVFFCQFHIRAVQTFLSMETSVTSSMGQVGRICYYIAKSLSGIWSFDFPKVSNIVPLFCISEKITDLSALWFDYIPVVYTMFLVLVTYVCIELYSRSCRIVVLLWKPFRYLCVRIKRKWSSNESIIHAYATMTFLMFTRIMSVFFNMNVKTALITNNDTQVYYVLYLDPHMRYSSSGHFPYLLISNIFLIVFGLCPALFLCLYPTRLFKRFMVHCFSSRKRIALSLFADTFQGCYKDGLHGTKDYRMTPGFIMLFTLVYTLFATYYNNYFSIYSNWFNMIMMILLSFVVLYIQPCKSWLMNASLSFHTVVLSFVVIASTMWNVSTNVPSYVLANVFVTLFTVPHIIMSLWVIYSVVNCVRRQQYYIMSSY